MARFALQIGTPNETYNLASTNTATALAAGKIVAADGTPAKSCMITCETNAIRYAFGGSVPTPTAGTGVGHLLEDGDSLELSSVDAIRTIQIISAVAGSHAALKVTVGF